jgi:signal recognition particle GTPase
MAIVVITTMKKSSLLTIIMFNTELMDVMTEKELDNPELITGLVKTRISMKSGRTPEEVGKLIHMYKQSKVIATWLQEK